ADALGPRTLNRKITLTSLFTDTPALQVNETQAFQGPLVITGDVATSGTIGVGDTFTFNHYGTVQIDTTLVKTDKGTLHLENYKGSTVNPVDSIDDLVINGGLVEFGSSYFNSQPLGDRTFSATINTGGVLRLASNDAFGGDYVDLQTSLKQLKIIGGTLRLNGNQYVPTPLVEGEGAIVMDGGVIDGGFALNSSKSTTGRSTISVRPNSVGSEIRNLTLNTTGSTFDPGAPFVFDVADGAAADDLTLTVTGASSTYKITGNFGIVKQGAGNLVLTQASDYLGTATSDSFGQPDGTTVVAGTLTAANTAGSATGTGTVKVNSGATLAGTGFITGATTVAGSITPGKGATLGTLSLGKTTLTGSLKARVNGAAFDQLAVTGDLNLTGATLALTATNPTAASYVIARYTGTLTGSFASVTGLPTGYTLVSNPAAKTIAIQSGTPQSGFDAWASAAGLTGADALTTADPDGDGIKNGIEFVIGGNPKVADTANLPTAVRDSSGNLVFTFRRTSASAYLNPGVQYSADLVTWTAAPAAAVASTTDGFATGVDKVVVTLPASLASGAKLFARLVDTTNAQ
ncbi:MAG: hypothetical protein JWO82_30, partial [Akkermansiaceae bacterium]|nr:hypothetical protein [Akkermansiaceae bacterium]